MTNENNQIDQAPQDAYALLSVPDTTNTELAAVGEAICVAAGESPMAMGLIYGDISLATVADYSTGSAGGDQTSVTGVVETTADTGLSYAEGDMAASAEPEDELQPPAEFGPGLLAYEQDLVEDESVDTSGFNKVNSDIDVPDLILRPDAPVDLTRLLTTFPGKNGGSKSVSNKKKKANKKPPVVAVVATAQPAEQAKPHKLAPVRSDKAITAPAAEKPAQLAFLLQSPEDRDLAIKVTDLRQEEDIDGIDHLNCNMFHGKTELGAFLDIYAQAPFEHPQFGHFESVAGFRLFIGREGASERFRKLYGKTAQFATRDAEFKVVENMQKLVANATWIKIIAYPDRCRELALCKLVLDNYYLTDAGVRGYTRGASRYLQVIDEIRKTLAMSMADGKSYYPKFDFLDAVNQPRSKGQRSQQSRY